MKLTKKETLKFIMEGECDLQAVPQKTFCGKCFYNYRGCPDYHAIVDGTPITEWAEKEYKTIVREQKLKAIEKL